MEVGLLSIARLVREQPELERGLGGLKEGRAGYARLSTDDLRVVHAFVFDHLDD